MLEGMIYKRYEVDNDINRFLTATMLKLCRLLWRPQTKLIKNKTYRFNLKSEAKSSTSVIFASTVMMYKEYVMRREMTLNRP